MNRQQPAPDKRPKRCRRVDRRSAERVAVGLDVRVAAGLDVLGRIVAAEEIDSEVSVGGRPSTATADEAVLADAGNPPASRQNEQNESANQQRGPQVWTAQPGQWMQDGFPSLRAALETGKLYSDVALGLKTNPLALRGKSPLTLGFRPGYKLRPVSPRTDLGVGC